jgi:hypothetical protein
LGLATPPASTFLSRSAFAIQLELGGGAPFGDIIDEEERSTTVHGIYSDGSVQDGTISHDALHFGVNAEFAPLRSRNARLALRAGYLYTSLGQEAKIGGGSYEIKTETAQLLRSHAALFGPVLYVGKRWFGSLQFMAGPMSGTIHPYPLASRAQLVSVSDVGFGGWMLRVGPGFGYAFEHFVLGGELLYSYSSMSFHDGIPPDGAKSSSLNGVAGNFHGGIHF